MMLCAARTRSNVSTSVATRGPISLRTCGTTSWIICCAVTADFMCGISAPCSPSSASTAAALADFERFSTSATCVAALDSSAARSLPPINCRKSDDSSPEAFSRLISASSAALARFSLSVAATTDCPIRCTSACAALNLASASAFTVAAYCSIAVACAAPVSAPRLVGMTSPVTALIGSSAFSSAAFSPVSSLLATSTAFWAFVSPASASRTSRLAALPSPNTLSQSPNVFLSAGDSACIAEVTSVSSGNARVMPTPRSAPRSTRAIPRGVMVADGGATRSTEACSPVSSTAPKKLLCSCTVSGAALTPTTSRPSADGRRSGGSWLLLG